MKIIAYPRFYFCKIKDDLINNNRCALISILNYDDTEKIIEDIPGKSVTLTFDDIGRYDIIPEDLLSPYCNMILFNKEHAEKIINFQKTLGKEIEYIIIHCTAGVSRSGAIATFLQEIYNDDNDWFIKNNNIHPNIHVLTLLRSVYKNNNYLKI